MGYFLSCAFLSRSAIGHVWSCEAFVFFSFPLSSWLEVWRNLSAEDSDSSCLKPSLVEVVFEPTHTRVYQISRLKKFWSLAPLTTGPSCLVFLVCFAFYLCDLSLLAFSLQRSVLLLSFRHPFQKICGNGSAFKPRRILLWGNLSAEDSASWRLKRFWREWDWNAHAHTRLYQVSRPGTSCVWRPTQLGFFPGFRRHFCFWVAPFQSG